MPEQCAVIIDRLVELRHQMGMTQKELAAAASIPQSAIARLEKKRAVPQLDTLIKVAAALGCNLQLLPMTDTEYLSSVPGVSDKIVAAADTPDSEFVAACDVNW